MSLRRTVKTYVPVTFLILATACALITWLWPKGLRDDLASSAPSAIKPAIEAAPKRGLPLRPAMLATGDLIFRKGRSQESFIVSLLDASSPFSHVGLVLRKGAEAFVIHIVPGDPAKGKDRARIDALAVFLAPDKASRLGVYRLRKTYASYAVRAVKIASSFVDHGVRFDKEFDIHSTDKQYCTELVWRAYKEAGLDLADSKAASGPKWILPSLLFKSRYLREVTSQ